MTAETRETLFRHLIILCKEIAGGEYRDVAELFELTKDQLYPPVVAELAEAFGMMMVQLEAREYRLNEIIAEMKAVQTELASAREHLSRENLRLKKTLKETFGPVRILGTSPAIQELLKRVEKIADTPVNVLITGETGTGKELIAKTIHYNSSRSDRPFLALNCTAIPETIFESEMFGIEKGVATGVEKRIGKIEQADGGTIFLDEIGDMPLASQGKILRVIEERRVERVGGRGSIPVDVRIMAATHRDLKAGIEKGTFREDLYYRLNVINLHVPPLRDRREDIPLLVKFFSERAARLMGRPEVSFSPAAMERLRAYPWPGNVRELENEVERAVALAFGEIITPEGLSENLLGFSCSDTNDRSLSPVKNAERLLIEKTLGIANGNKTQAARLLGLSREGLRRKLQRYGLS